MANQLTKGRGKAGSMTIGGGTYFVKRIPITVLTTGEKDTSFDLPVKAVVKRVFVDVKTAEVTGATKTVDVGLLSSETNGDADGFLVAAVTSAIGVIPGSLLGTDTLGALLKEDTNGSSVFVPKDHIVLPSKAVSVTYTLGSAHTELVADIVIEFLSL